MNKPNFERPEKSYRSSSGRLVGAAIAWSIFSFVLYMTAHTLVRRLDPHINQAMILLPVLLVGWFLLGILWQLAGKRGIAVEMGGLRIGGHL